MNKTIFAFSLLTSITLTLSSCNTIAGFGEDISRGGQSINNAAHKTSKAIDNAGTDKKASPTTQPSQATAPATSKSTTKQAR